MNKLRAKTAEEVRKEFLDYLGVTIKYWCSLPDKTKEDACDGVVFSILNIFDGTTIRFPAMDIVLKPHPGDQEYCRAENKNWYEDGMVINNCMLHEEWCERESTQ